MLNEGQPALDRYFKVVCLTVTPLRVENLTSHATPKAISDRLGKGVDSSLTNGSRLYTCKYRHAYTLRTEHYDKSTAELPMTPNLLPLTGFGMVWPSND